jgi:hypothetical protein
MTHSVGLAVLAAAILGFAQGAHAVPIVYTANLTGPGESPPNASPGTGFAEVDFDIVAHAMRVQVSFSGLLGTTTMSHIHSPTVVPGTGTAAVATQVPFFVGFPLGVTSGTYDHTLDTSLASTYNPAFVTANGGTPSAAEAALAASLGAGTAYLNIHSNLFPGGEIRGFLGPRAVPEPATIGLLALGALLLVYARRRRVPDSSE